MQNKRNNRFGEIHEHPLNCQPHPTRGSHGNQAEIYDLEQDYAKDRFHFARADEISLGKADLFCPAADMEGISKTDQRNDSH